MSRLAVLAIAFAMTHAMAREPAFPTSRIQKIEQILKVGYGLRIADLNDDGEINIVACGRTTGNVLIYWNVGREKN